MELPAQSPLAASHHRAVSDPNLLDAFNRDAAVQKRTVPEAAEAATALRGKTAATAIAWCAVSAYCYGRIREYRFWFRVFAYLCRSGTRVGEGSSRLFPIGKSCSTRELPACRENAGPKSARQGQSRIAVARAAPALTGSFRHGGRLGRRQTPVRAVPLYPSGYITPAIRRP